ncbi:DNA-binding transcriptional regulator, AcrR family [Tsukamurella tyrosinosolvens]|uniref:DNA-binding transcriptional regulator, AcrR family n=1 Tax=Tsukamurella tyrosinosolvens TaxID=57704 RepID=A0A1H4SK57_TSUTY|nr:DNA-binding transcriptional regulator, AcrR family [Tsukamurella tyrosinosolvens]
MTSGERRESRREQIIRAGFAELCDRGYEATTIADIARRAGISQGAMYRHFSGKRELLDEVFDYGVERMWDKIEPEELLSAADPADAVIAERISEAGRRLFQLLDEEPDLLRLLIVESTAIDPELRMRAVGVENILISYLAPMLAATRQARSPELPPSVDSDVVARMLVALLAPGLAASMADRFSGERRERFIESARIFIENGIFTEGDSGDGEK